MGLLVFPCLLWEDWEIRHLTQASWINVCFSICVCACLHVCAHVSLLFLSLLHFSLNGKVEDTLPLHHCRSLPKNTRLPHHLHPDLETTHNNYKESTTQFFYTHFLTPCHNFIYLLQSSGEINPKKDLFIYLTIRTISYVQHSSVLHSPQNF